MDINNLKYYENNCRTCLGVSEKMLPIHLVDEKHNKSMSIYEQLKSFTNLKINKNDALPKSICFVCAEKINNAISFKNQCETIEQMLYNLEINNDITNNIEEKFVNNETEDNNISLETIALNANDDSELCDNEMEGLYCSYCNKTFKNRGGFVKHRIVIHKINNRSTCSVCKKEFLSINVLMQHQKEIHDIKQPWKCKFCIKSFATKTGLDYHMSQHDNVLKKYKCKLCKRAFKLKCSLNIHLKTSHRTLSVSCQFCKTRFVSRTSMEEHLSSVHNDKSSHMCDVCKKSFITAKAVLIHKLRTHRIHKPNLHICKICNKKYISKVALEKHVEKHHSLRTNILHNFDDASSLIYETDSDKLENVKLPKSNLCNICGKRFASSCYLRDHIRIHSGIKPFKCTKNNCKSSFVMKVGLESHLKLAHSDVRPYLCTECGASFKTKSSLQIHTRTHTGEKPYICKICGKRYRASGHLRHHLLMHDGGDPQHCQICNKVLSNKSSFRSHMRNHENPKDNTVIPDRPFACSDCDKTFVQAKDLKIHEMLHTGDLPFRCDVCGIGFNRASNYKKHMLRHSDNRPHVCEHCGAGFVTKYLMVSHINKAHIGIRNFKCDICPSAFFDTTGLGKHKRKVHKILKRELLISSKKLSMQVQTDYLGAKDRNNEICRLDSIPVSTNIVSGSKPLLRAQSYAIDSNNSSSSNIISVINQRLLLPTAVEFSSEYTEQNHTK